MIEKFLLHLLNTASAYPTCKLKTCIFLAESHNWDLLVGDVRVLKLQLDEFQMSTPSSPNVYDTLLDVLAGCADRNAILSFRLNGASQERLDLLLEKHRDATLSKEEASELETYEQFEHVVRLLKARVLQSQPS